MRMTISLYLGCGHETIGLPSSVRPIGSKPAKPQ